MNLIGLCGPAGGGKDSVAMRLRDKHGFTVLAFADPLYAAVAAISGMSVSDLKNRRLKEDVIPWMGKSPRQLLQLLGTEFGRGMIRDDVWIQRTMMRLDPSEAGYAITDVRFDNEAEAICDRGGSIVEVVRPGSACLRDDTACHSSEAGIRRDYIARTILNDGTLEDLAASADEAVTSLHAAIM